MSSGFGTKFLWVDLVLLTAHHNFRQYQTAKGSGLIWYSSLAFDLPIFQECIELLPGYSYIPVTELITSELSAAIPCAHRLEMYSEHFSDLLRRVILFVHVPYHFLSVTIPEGIYKAARCHRLTVRAAGKTKRAVNRHPVQGLR